MHYPHACDLYSTDTACSSVLHYGIQECLPYSTRLSANSVFLWYNPAMQTDILTLIQNRQWKQYGDFVVPAYLTKRMLSALDVSAAVYMTHEEVLGKKYTREELENDLAQLSLEDCIATTSKILTVLTNLGQLNTNVQAGITQELFKGDLKEKILGLLTKEPKRIVFFDLQLLLLVKYAMLFAKHEPANSFGGEELASTYTKVVLGITDILSEKTEGTS